MMKNDTSYIDLLTEQVKTSPRNEVETYDYWEKKGWMEWCDDCNAHHVTTKGVAALAFMNDMTAPMILQKRSQNPES